MTPQQEAYIQQTAKDYDLDYDTVAHIYTRLKCGESLYTKLEEHLIAKARSNADAFVIGSDGRKWLA